MPILVKKCANDLISAAPIGSISAQIGQLIETPALSDKAKVALRTPAVPIISCQVKFSPNHKTPIIPAKSGVVEDKVVDSVGPKNRVPATAKFAESDGRNIPIKINIKIVGFVKFEISR